MVNPKVNENHNDETYIDLISDRMSCEQSSRVPKRLLFTDFSFLSRTRDNYFSNLQLYEHSGRTLVTNNNFLSPVHSPPFFVHNNNLHQDMISYFHANSFLKNISYSTGNNTLIFDPCAKPFLLLHRAKQLLSEQRINEAREILKIGSVQYQEDSKILKLLRAISPGRVQRIRGFNRSRKLEFEWLRKYGPNYRGLWVAISGSNLVASAATLNKLLIEVGDNNHIQDIPLIQKISPE